MGDRQPASTLTNKQQWPHESLPPLSFPQALQGDALSLVAPEIAEDQVMLFTCTGFGGHYPVGTSAVIVAEDEVMARIALDAALKRAGLPGIGPDDHLKMMNPRVPAVRILCDGNY